MKIYMVSLFHRATIKKKEKSFNNVRRRTYWISISLFCIGVLNWLLLTYESDFYTLTFSPAFNWQNTIYTAVPTYHECHVTSYKEPLACYGICLAAISTERRSAPAVTTKDLVSLIYGLYFYGHYSMGAVSVAEYDGVDRQHWQNS